MYRCLPLTSLPLASLAFLLLAPLNSARAAHPIVYVNGFEVGAEGWAPSDPAGWKILKTDRGHVYSQFKKRSKYRPPHRSPFNISILKSIQVRDFELNVRVRSTHPDYGHRDACVVFGYQDPAHFYYVHLGKKTDDHANQIFLVNAAPRTKISTKTTPGTNWDDAWHNVRIRRNTQSGRIEVFFDDMKNPVMVATDKHFLYGSIGLGSFDDTTEWDDLVLRGVQKVERQ